jgi:UDP-N-acetylmuramate--alanine ligase
VFQPHRYSRTQDHLDDFASELSRCDLLILTEVYAAGERPLAGADGRALSRAVRMRGRLEPVFIPTLQELPELLSAVLMDGDVVLTLGAGDIGAAAANLPRRMAHSDTGGTR